MLGRQAKGIIETEALQLEGAGLREKQKEARMGQGAGCGGGGGCHRRRGQWPEPAGLLCSPWGRGTLSFEGFLIASAVGLHF